MPRQSAAALVEITPIRFGLSDVESAGAISISVTKFREMVADGRMPRPRMIDARRVWDIDEVRSAFKRLPYDGGEPDVADDPFGKVVP